MNAKNHTKMQFSEGSREGEGSAHSCLPPKKKIPFLKMLQLFATSSHLLGLEFFINKSPMQSCQTRNEIWIQFVIHDTSMGDILPINGGNVCIYMYMHMCVRNIPSFKYIKLNLYQTLQANLEISIKTCKR